MAEDLRPDLVLMDLSLPVLSGVAATKRIRALVPTTKVVALSMLSDETAVSSALAAGAVGYLVKDSTTAEIVSALGQVMVPPRKAGGVPFGGHRHLRQRPRRPNCPTTIGIATDYQQAGGRGSAPGGHRSIYPEVGRRLYISAKTVKNHLSSIYQKLDSHDRAQAVLKAVRMVSSRSIRSQDPCSGCTEAKLGLAAYGMADRNHR